MQKSLPYTLSALFACAVVLQTCQADSVTDADLETVAFPDTLVLRTEKVKGTDLFGFGAGFLQFQDTTDLYGYPVRYPSSMMNMQGASWWLDPAADDAENIDVIVGSLDGEDVFIVDQNNNRDFTDDPVRRWEVADSDSRHSFLVYHRSTRNGQVYQDSSWIQIGLSRFSDEVIYARDEHLRTDVTVGQTKYRLGTIDPMHSTTSLYTDKSEIAILAVDGRDRDTLPRQDIFRAGESLVLGDTYYRFDSITRYGDYITLIREPDFASRTGTQVGMLAPAFEVVTTEGDTLQSAEMVDKPTVVANSCGCGGDRASTEAFSAIENTYGKDIYVLRLDSDFRYYSPGWKVDVEAPYNADIYQDYRKEFCSRDAYLLSKDHRVVAKFDIMDWAVALEPHIKP